MQQEWGQFPGRIAVPSGFLRSPPVGCRDRRNWHSTTLTPLVGAVCRSTTKRGSRRILTGVQYAGLFFPLRAPLSVLVAQSQLWMREVDCGGAFSGYLPVFTSPRRSLVSLSSPRPWVRAQVGWLGRDEEAYVNYGQLSVYVRRCFKGPIVSALNTVHILATKERCFVCRALRNAGAAVAERLDCSPPTKKNRIESLTVHAGCSQVGIVPDDAAGRRVFSRVSRFPLSRIPALLRSLLILPSSALKTSLLRAAQISQLNITKRNFTLKKIMNTTVFMFRQRLVFHICPCDDVDVDPSGALDPRWCKEPGGRTKRGSGIGSNLGNLLCSCSVHDGFHLRSLLAASCLS
ncbi:hypothetical protein PR048_022379 [Dryococelus australis]|uniref:Uncharacterized protein n=1 Tax=Dryococelus australis TaxID=614101 RepID=A0ABQ9H0U1_9NEOP|nr:hypothetical protein PR048_022379 [Dryococelus australis]